VILSPDQVAAATGCPKRNVAEHWPNLAAALAEQGIDTLAVEVAAAATVAIETSAFLPIHERRADPKKQPKLWATQERYWPSGYYGRGFIQLTWRGNYLDAGEALGLDLVGMPELALDSSVAARILALYFKGHGIPAAAEAGDWKRVRRLVNGGLPDFDRFLRAVQALQESARG
jgi:predicted chitinase